MKCEFCGHNNDPGSRFCSGCGAQSQQAPQTDSYNPAQKVFIDDLPEDYEAAQQARRRAAQKVEHRGELSGIAGAAKNLPVKKLLMIIVPLLVVIVAAIIIIPMIGSGGGGSATVKDSIVFFADRDEIIISGNNNTKFKVDGEIESMQRSLDGSKAVVLVDYLRNNGGTLWFVTTTGSYKVAENVLQYQLADSGNGVAYIKDHDSRSSLATLYLYDTSSKKETLITEDSFYNGEFTACISPNGKDVGYISDYNSRTNTMTGYVKADNKAAEKLEVNMFAVAISDGGRYLYYIKTSNDRNSGSMHVRSGRNENRLASNVDDLKSLMLSRDYSEALFTVEDRTFIIRNANERERVSGAAIENLILPRGVPRKDNSNNAGISVVGLRSFSNLVGYTGEGLVFYDSTLTPNKISGSFSHRNRAVLSADSKTLYYITNNGHLSAIDPAKSDVERREVGRDVSAFVTSNDGQTVYYINNDRELWHVKGSGTPLRIADDAASSFLALANNSPRVFFIIDYNSGRGGELYYSDNGGRRTRVSGADEVKNVWSTTTSVFYVTRDNELYRSGGDEKFSRFHDEINNIW